MTEKIYQVGRLPDLVIKEIFEQVATLIGQKECVFHFGTGRTLSTKLSEIGSIEISADSYHIESANLTSDEKMLRMDFGRGEITSDKFDSRRPSIYFDTIQIAEHRPQNKPNRVEIATFLGVCKIIEEKTKLPAAALLTVPPSEATDALHRHVAELSGLQIKLLDDANTARQGFEEHRNQLEKDFNERKKQLDEEIDSERSKISEEKQEILRLSKELDDRGHMHVRRELRQTITDNIKGRLEKSVVSSPLKKNRIAVLILCLIGAVSFGAFALWSQFLLQESIETLASGASHKLTAADWILLGRIIAGSIVAIGFLLYAINWWRKMYLEDVAVERTLERYGYDIDRASWSIETIIEMSQRENAEVPTAWVEGVCRNLFEDPRQQHDEPTALQAWGALLNVAGSAEVGPDGPKVTLNRRAARKVAQSGD